MTERDAQAVIVPQFPLELNYYLKQMWLRIDVLSRHQTSTQLGAHFDHLITCSFNDLCCLNFREIPQLPFLTSTWLDETSRRNSSSITHYHPSSPWFTSRPSFCPSSSVVLSKTLPHLQEVRSRVDWSNQPRSSSQRTSALLLR